MSGRAEQKRRANAVKREVETELRRVYVLLEAGDVDLARGYLQTKLGLTKPIEQIRKELKRESVH